jgi:hypothetical protein
MATIPGAVRSNVRFFRLRCPEPQTSLLRDLREITREFQLSLERGELLLLSGKWYITHAGLLKIAHRDGCAAIEVEPALEFSAPDEKRWVFRATVRKQGDGHVFVGYGDADPTNVGPNMHGAELRIAETRAVNRALRKAYGIGLCSAEELGAVTNHPPSPPAATASNGRVTEMRVRNRLVSLIRRHQLDADEVKRYAAEFCGTETLRDATRSLVEDFVDRLERWAKEDLEGLRKHLAGYSEQKVAS